MDGWVAQTVEPQVSECIFWELVAGRGPVSSFYEDDVVLGLMTYPAGPRDRAQWERPCEMPSSSVRGNPGSKPRVRSAM